jgi:RNA polymerase sigma-70 factor (ECF subfamily)
VPARARAHRPVRKIVTEPTLPNASQLVVAIAARQDRESFATLFSYYAPRVKAYLMRLATDAALAEELAQEAMLIVWRRAGAFDPQKASASTWIFTIARNLRIDAARRAKYPAALGEDPFPSSPPPLAADAMIADERALRLKQSLACLPSEQMEIVRLSFFEDKAHSEIARELAIPLGTVKSRLRLAMAYLRPRLEDLK